MLRKHENTYSFKAGAMAIAVHIALLGAMLVSFNWKAAHPVMNVTEVELWDKLPSEKSLLKPEPMIEKPQPVPLQEKPAPKPVIEKLEPKIEDQKVDIVLDKKKKELAEKKQEEKKREDLQKKEKELEDKNKLAALQAETRDDELKEKKQQDKKDKEALKKLQQEALADDNAANNKQASAANASAKASMISEFKAKIQAKIRGNVNKTVCGDGNPELRFEIGLLPTGELSGTPKLTKSSGIAACDDAVERAIAASQPLPLPSDASLFSSFRNLNLKFKPND